MINKPDLKDHAEHMGDKVENKIDQAKGWMKEKWGWLTDDDLMEIKGKVEQIKAKFKDHYGDAKWEAEFERFRDEYPEYLE